MTSHSRLPRLVSAVRTEENLPSRSQPSLQRTSSILASSVSESLIKLNTGASHRTSISTSELLQTFLQLSVGLELFSDLHTLDLHSHRALSEVQVDRGELSEIRSTFQDVSAVDLEKQK